MNEIDTSILYDKVACAKLPQEPVSVPRHMGGSLPCKRWPADHSGQIASRAVFHDALHGQALCRLAPLTTLISTTTGDAA